jgi:TatD DNase family protein
MRLFDSHCHLDDEGYARDLEEVLARARAAGVAAVMVAGINAASSRRAAALAADRAMVHAAVGVHPHDARHCSETVLQELARLAAQPGVKAWGETGLDFNRMFSPQEDQERWFARQLQTALELNLPVILHERDSRGRLLEMLRQHLPRENAGGVVHCFSGDRRELEAYLDLGLHIGITGVITMDARGAELRQLVKRVPEGRLLVETDAPYLTPAPERNRHRRNEPAFVATVLRKLAEARDQEPAALAATIWANTCRLFGIADQAA